MAATKNQFPTPRKLNVLHTDLRDNALDALRNRVNNAMRSAEDPTRVTLEIGVPPRSFVANTVREELKAQGWTVSALKLGPYPWRWSITPTPEESEALAEPKGPTGASELEMEVGEIIRLAVNGGEDCDQIAARVLEYLFEQDSERLGISAPK